ncbi:hypothetical protein M758_2G122600 [Ceratodon purpureus]|nr:hypothetical protein M758_2G122600 [Ceratodon purpureus]
MSSVLQGLDYQSHKRTTSCATTKVIPVRPKYIIAWKWRNPCCSNLHRCQHLLTVRTFDCIVPCCRNLHRSQHLLSVFVAPSPACHSRLSRPSSPKPWFGIGQFFPRRFARENNLDV